MKNIADVVAYVTFQSPVYVAILLVVGADWHSDRRGGKFQYRCINDDGRSVRLFPRLLPSPVPRQPPTCRPKPELIQKATGSASRFCQLYCVSPNRPLRKRSSAIRELNPCGIP